MSTTAATQLILEMQGITKRFPGVVALDEVDFGVNRSEIHALIGQNGAGKSTLMKILAGDYMPSEGEIFIDGQPVTFRHPRDAQRLGIAIVHQELSLLPNLSVADNIFLGRELGQYLVVNESGIEIEAQKVLDRLGIQHIDVYQKVEALPLAQQQLVEIARALSYKPQILILDEPTATLTPEDAERLFEILIRLKAEGIAIIYITHRLKEIIRHCDRGTILRNGKVIKVISIKDTTEEELIELMIGQKMESFFRRDKDGERAKDGRTLLEVSHLSSDKIRDVNFQLGPGEIIGITGLLGAGQNELARILFGVQGYVSGTIKRNGQPVTLTSPQAALKVGICLLTENRKEEGIFLNMSVKENITMPSLTRFVWAKAVPILVNGRERQAAGKIIEKMNVVLRSAEGKIRTLSGGNQQKALLGRWLLRNPEVLVFIEPTRGIDVGAKAEIYRHLESLAREGRGIIVISPDLTEILGISDRIFVMHNGYLVNELYQAEATEELLLAAMQGSAISQ